MGKPAWRGVFDRIERAVGLPLEEAVASRRYIDFVVFWMNGPLAMNRVLCQLVDDQLGRVLHLLNMPTRDDVNRLNRQLSVLTAEVRGLSLPADRIEGFVSELHRREPRPGASTKGGSVASVTRPVPRGRDGT
jgi:hypothetical protein